MATIGQIIRAKISTKLETKATSKDKQKLKEKGSGINYIAKQGFVKWGKMIMCENIEIARRLENIENKERHQI